MPTLDPRDIFYAVTGLALLVLTLQPVLTRLKVMNLPLVFVAVGALLGYIGAPLLDPRAGGLATKAIEHASELIVIISLAGAGLAIDTRGTWSNWQPAFRLLIIAMPLTIISVALMGLYGLGLSLASAMLLAAALAPTDPVLARSVQVGPPGKEETPMQLALTAEAGLNDGLAFPFIYLAITLATVSAGEAWFVDWFTFDFLYRVTAGLVVGYGLGWLISRLAYSRFGDASQGAWNSIVMVLASTLLAYGITEAVDGYGFLAVFAATRAGRENSRNSGREGYEKYVHHGADQLESILLVLLLLWFGLFVGGGGLEGLRWQEVLFAIALIFFVRPVGGWLSMRFYDCAELETRKVAFFGVRGMGSIFYVAYAQNHASFAEMDAVWRITGIVILLSILVHGFAASFVFRADHEEEHPYREDRES